MEVSLQTFVAESIKEVVLGITDAQTEITDSFQNDGDPKIIVGTEGFQRVEFDVSVTSTSSEETSGKGGVSIKVLDFGVKGSNAAAQTAVNRIKFSVLISVERKSNYSTSR